MKANELRIGNLVEFSTPILVINVTETKHLVTSNDIANFENGKILLEPIQITNELLIMLGFNYVDELYYYANDNHCISETNNELDYFVFMPFCTNDEDCFIKIKYVHQLQNLVYALCGTELTLKQ